jgi:hypothetical protein
MKESFGLLNVSRSFCFLHLKGDNDKQVGGDLRNYPQFPGV